MKELPKKNRNGIRRRYHQGLIIAFITFIGFIFIFYAFFKLVLLIPITDIATFTISCLAYVLSLLMIFKTDYNGCITKYYQDIELNLKHIEIISEQIQKIYNPISVITENNEISCFENIYLNRYIVDLDEQIKIEKINKTILEEKTFKNVIEELNYFKEKNQDAQRNYDMLRKEAFECLHKRR